MESKVAGDIYDGRCFRAVSNSESGEVSGGTLFRYRQDGTIVWAEYSGGDVIKGFLLGKVLAGNRLEFTYQHINAAGEIRVGRCETTPEPLPDGRLRLHERWQWLNGGCEIGTSVLEELDGPSGEALHRACVPDLPDPTASGSNPLDPR